MATVVVGTAVVADGVVVVGSGAVVVGSGAVVVGTTVVGGSVAGEAVVVVATTAVVGTTVPPVDEEQPDASMAEANRTDRITWQRRTTLPFKNRLRRESVPARLTIRSRKPTPGHPDDPMASEDQGPPADHSSSQGFHPDRVLTVSPPGGTDRRPPYRGISSI
jgi:hypothetical protein